MRTIRWGIIGAGHIAEKFALALNSLKDTELTAIASRSADKAYEFAERFHVRKAYGSYEELVKDSEIDVIYIATPHTEHRKHASLCITHGKAVLCEKPFTVNQREAEVLITLAKEHKVFLMEGMWTKFLPATRMVKQWIDENRIGKVKYLQASFGFYSEFNPKSRLYDPHLAGGALLDVGVYPVSYATFLLGKLPDQVKSSASIGKSKVDETNIIAMHFEDGTLADLSSAISANTGNDAVIIGENGRIVVPTFWAAEKAELYNAAGKLVETFSLPFTSNGFVYEVEEVNRCLREGKLQSDIIPHETTLAIMKLLDGIRAEWGLVYPTE